MRLYYEWGFIVILFLWSPCWGREVKMNIEWEPVSSDTESTDKLLPDNDTPKDTQNGAHSGKKPANHLAKKPDKSAANNVFLCRTKGKEDAILAGGGTEESEKAVAAALEWLANHQYPNGGWCFQHQMCPKCQGKCSNPGTGQQALNAATAMALLSFLGAGETHKDGKYSSVVRKGLLFLRSQGKSEQQAVSFRELKGSMYSHGLATACLAEAYAMTKDRSLLPAAQGALNYIAFAQDPAGGGWRYQPKQSGDVSVTGWQLMALKSGYLAKLKVSNDTIARSSRFFDSMQVLQGARYGYTEPGNGTATTAIGLLCRMNMGWKHDNRALAQGVDWLTRNGPSRIDNYTNYYITQVLFQYKGPLWEQWNSRIRPALIKSQSQTGHEAGSWATDNIGYSATGGRLYDTALSTLILEVYYRYPPIYSEANN